MTLLDGEPSLLSAAARPHIRLASARLCNLYGNRIVVKFSLCHTVENSKIQAYHNYVIIVIIENPMPIIKPISDLRNKANQLSELVHTGREPVFITKNGEGDMVL